MKDDPFYIAANRFEMGESFPTRDKAIAVAIADVADGAEERYVYEVRLVGKATKRVEFTAAKPDTSVEVER